MQSFSAGRPKPSMEMLALAASLKSKVPEHPFLKAGNFRIGSGAASQLARTKFCFQPIAAF